MKTDFHKIECDILVALSDFLPHNQNQIADLIGKNHKGKSTNRVNVSRCLKNIEPYLKRVPNELDELGKKWVLKQEIETIKQMIKTYPSLIPDLQNNDKILDMLQDMHPEFRGLDIEFTPETMANLDLPVRFKSYPGRVVMLKDVLIPLIKASEQGFKDDFKEYLRESPTFFKMCLLHDSEHLKDKAVGVHYAFLSAIVQDKEKVKTQCDSASGYMLNNSFYWLCRLVDVLEL